MLCFDFQTAYYLHYLLPSYGPHGYNYLCNFSDFSDFSG